MSKDRRFRAFDRFDLADHSNRICRRSRVVDTTDMQLTRATVLAAGRLQWIGLPRLLEDGSAWAGGVRSEKNRPATLRHPFSSVAGDRVMDLHNLRGRVPL